MPDHPIVQSCPTCHITFYCEDVMCPECGGRLTHCAGCDCAECQREEETESEEARTP
mgnify:CR=1 FL=1